MTTIDPRELAGRYVAVWNEPDAKLRREAIRGLWAEDGAHLLQPPQQIQQAAAALGFPAATLQARGHGTCWLRSRRSLSSARPARTRPNPLPENKHPAPAD